MSQIINIRPAFYDDESAVVAIMNEAITEERNGYLKEFDWIEGASWYQGLREDSIHMVVCTINEMVVGWGNLSIYRNGRAAFKNVNEISYYVSKQHRKLGVATRIVEALEEEAIGYGIKHLVAIMLDDNVPGRTLLEKKGYFVWGLFEGIAEFKNNSKGHLFMGKTL